MLRRAKWEHLAVSAYPALVGAIAVAAFGARVQNFDASVYGDEAYYYFFSHDPSRFLDTSTYPIAGSTFPVMPFLYWPFSSTLASTRSFNALVGAAVVVLVVAILGELRVARSWR